MENVGLVLLYILYISTRYLKLKILGPVVQN